MVIYTQVATRGVSDKGATVDQTKGLYMQSSAHEHQWKLNKGLAEWTALSKKKMISVYCLLFVPAGSPSPGEDVTVYVYDINQSSLPTRFYSALESISVFTALPTVFHFINSPVTLRFLTLFFQSFLCLVGPPCWSCQLYASFYESLLQP